MEGKNIPGLILFDDETVVYAVNEPLILEASAGSGKTTVLVERLVSILVYLICFENLSPIDALNSIVAITFTRKAASEMKERIREKIENFNPAYLSAVIDKISIYYPTRAPVNKDRAVDKLMTMGDDIYNALSGANISTIHSYGLSLLRNNPVEAQIDPAASPDDENGGLGQSMTSRDALFDAMRGLIDSGDNDFALLVKIIGYEKVRSLMKSIFKNADEVGISEFEVLSRDSGYLVYEQDYREGAYQNDERARSFIFRTLSPVILNLKSYLDQLSQMKTSKSVERLISVVSDVAEENVLGLFSADLTNTDKPTKNDIELNQLRETVKNTLLELKNRFHQILFPPLWAVCLKYLNRYNDLKAQRKQITFHEIEQKLVSALSEQPAFRARACKNLRYLMIDEYQDTSDIQKKVFQRLLGENDRAVPFIVGDPKQSIFRFRNANVEVFNDTKQEFCSRYGQESYRQLKYNYRSAPKVVEGINALFSEVFAEQSGGIAYTNQLSGKKADESKVTGVHFYPMKPGNTDEVIKCSAIKCADLILDLIARNEAEFGDIMVLVRRKKKVPIINEVFSEKLGGRFVNIDSPNILETQEIKNLIIYLKALDNPLSDYYFLPLLKSPFFRKSDAQVLSIIRTAEEKARKREVKAFVGRFFNEMSASDSSEMKLFLKFNHKKNRYNIPDLIEEIINQTGYYAYLNTLPHRKEATTNVIVFLNKLRSVQNVEMFNLTDFLYYLDVYGLHISKPQVVGEKSNVVRVMTAHSAKGLEANTVFYIGMGPGGMSDSVIIGKNPDRLLGLDLIFKDKNYEKLDEIEKNKSIFEEKRLAYVALTRAKEKFYYIGAALPDMEPRQRKTDGWSGFIHLGMNCFKSKTSPLMIIDDSDESRELKNEPPLDGQEKQPQGLDNKINELLEIYHKEVILDFPETVTITQLLDIEYNKGGYANKYLFRSFPVDSAIREAAEYDGELFAAKSSRADKGTFLHKVLQLANEMNYPDIIDVALKQENDELVSQKDSLVDMCRVFYESDYYKTVIREREKSWEEWEFNYICETDYQYRDESRVSKVLVKGTIDKYFISNGKGVVIDYKLHTDVNDSDRYFRQLNYYAVALQTFGYPVNELYLYHLEGGEFISVPIDINIAGTVMKDNVREIINQFTLINRQSTP